VKYSLRRRKLSLARSLCLSVDGLLGMNSVENEQTMSLDFYSGANDKL